MTGGGITAVRGSDYKAYHAKRFVLHTLARYTTHGIPLMVVQLTAANPSANEAEAITVSKRICAEHGVELTLSAHAAMTSVMELVAQSYAFDSDGALRRIESPRAAPLDSLSLLEPTI